MTQITVPVSIVFAGYENNSFRLFGVGPDGTATQLFSPWSDHLWEFSGYEVDLALDVGTTFAAVDDAFWFHYSMSENLGEGNIYYTLVARMSPAGQIEAVGKVTGLLPASAAGWAGETVYVAADHGGTYHLGLSPFSGGPANVYTIADDGTVTRISDFRYPEGWGFSGNLATVGETLFVKGDNRAPRDNQEVWRITATGQTELVFSDPGNSVSDVESFAGAAWFTTWGRVDPPILGRVTESGGVEQLPLPAFGSRDLAVTPRIKVFGERMFIYDRGFIGEVAADGSIAVLFDDPAITAIRDIALYRGQLHFSGDSMLGNGQLMRLEPGGLARPVVMPAHGAIEQLTLAGGSLYFEGDHFYQGEFGEPLSLGVLYRLGPDGDIERLTGPGSAAPQIDGVEGLFAFVVDPVLPINGTDGDDRLAGTAGDDTLRGGEGNDTLSGEGGDDLVFGGPGSDRLFGGAGHDTLHGGDGADTLNGGDGDDFLYGGETEADLRDLIYGGDGHDWIDGGWGNDELWGGEGNDTVLGGYGSDTIIGNAGDDQLHGGAGSDEIHGGPGGDWINGGWGYDRLNGGAGADTFFHQGVADHGSDWIQDYRFAEGDVLAVGIPGATRAQFQVNFANTPGAGAADVAEAFVIYRPTGQILFSLIDGAAQDSIVLQAGGQSWDLLA